MAIYTIYFTISIFLSEMCFRLSSLGKLGGFTIYLPFFVVLFAAFIALICSQLPKTSSTIVAGVFSLLIFAFYSVRLVYQHIFQSYLSISQLGMGTDAIKSFSAETAIGISQCSGYIFILALPLIAWIIYFICTLTNSGAFKIKKLNLMQGFLIFCAILAAQLFVPQCMLLQSDSTYSSAYSPREIYFENFILSHSEKYFGSLPSAFLEFHSIFFAHSNAQINFDAEAPGLSTSAEDGVASSQNSGNIGNSVNSGNSGNPDNESQNPDSKPDVDNSGANRASESDFGENKLDINFDKNGDADELELNRYFKACKVTNKNEYTGKFKDYNLIVLCCESFSPYLIDEERTPILYEMSQNGFVFNDYYSTVCDNTSNSEYVLLTGQLPDTSLLGKGWETFYEYNSCTASKENYLPFTLANQFNARGARSLAFHNYWGSYYNRTETHANFGYEFYSMGYRGIPAVEGMPTSDLDMMQYAMPKLLQSNEDGEIDQFHAYFMTFSGHMQYYFETNQIAEKNRDISEGLDYKVETRAYISCNQELEYALEYMMDQLESAGVADNTLIVLTQDHYPYALGLNRLSELAGASLNSTSFDAYINQYKGSLMIWSPSMTERVDIDFPVCELDILPTLLNLFGFEYDSRLLMGTDIFSDAPHYAILEDRGFVTENYTYDAKNDEIVSRNGTPPDSSSVQNLIAVIKNKFIVSNKVLYTDYFRYLFE